jgi:ubiquinone/menaquinone biosynthesis C-methylase UbiE
MILMDIKDVNFKSVDFWFKGKNELIDILIKKVAMKKKIKILNVGCGTADDLNVLLKYGDVTLVDKNKSVLELIKNKSIKKYIGDGRNLRFKDGSFDIVLMFDVLEHIKEDDIAIKEAHRVLKNCGYFIFIVPAFQFLFSSHDRALDHYRRYNINEIREKLNNLFEIQEIGYWNFILFVPIALSRLIKKSSQENVRIEIPSSFIRKILGKILEIDNLLIKKDFHLPFGLSIYGIARKVNTDDIK